MTTDEDSNNTPNEKVTPLDFRENTLNAPYTNKGRISSGLSVFRLKKKSKEKYQKSDATKPRNQPNITNRPNNLLPPRPNQVRNDEQSKPSENDLAITRMQESLQSSMDQNPKNLLRSKRSKSIRRFRGFSTSISSLFLDEQVVCGSISWFGLLASSRTEHLLNTRNASRRMAQSEGKRAPSKVLSTALVFSIILISLTYIIWGFGDVYETNSTNDGYDGYRRLEQKNNWNLFPSYGLMKVRDNLSLYSKLKKIIKHETSYKLSEENNSRALEDYDGSDNQSENESESTRESGKIIYWLDDQDLASKIRIFICLAFLLLLGLVGRRRRMRTRYAIIKARLQDDRIHHGGSRLTQAVGSRDENQYEGACSHTLCGCYPIDEVNEQQKDTEDDTREKVDCVNTIYAMLSAACCGNLCGLWAQFGSVCALAQEAREVRLLLAPKLQRLDFITYQPFAEYYEDIYFLRRSWKGMLESKASKRGWGPHIRALSTLSRYILLFFITATTAIILTERLNPRAAFLWGDAFVLLMTFLQSFCVLGIVHGIFHKSELSLDAVIKFFAAGFLIAFPTAFIFEWIIINCWLAVAFSLNATFGVIIGNSYTNWIDTHYRVLLIVAEIIQSFFVAAVTEELCKYYTFRTVEHPDLLFLTGLDRFEQQDDAFSGGHEAYPFSRDNTSKLNQSIEFSYGNRHNSHRGRSPHLQEIAPSKDTMSGEEREKDPDVRSSRQCAAAVTTAFISVAVGLACAENFVYVFFLGGNDTKEEMLMLLFRSIFPLHALTAAIQSIGIIKNFLEKDGQSSAKVGVGDIVIPAIILHGTFDSVLMLLNSFVEFSLQDYYNQDGGYYDISPYDDTILNSVGALIVIITILGGVFWYVRQNASQATRMKQEKPPSKNHVIDKQNPMRYMSPNLEMVAGNEVLV